MICFRSQRQECGDDGESKDSKGVGETTVKH
jgi:hypothetical protein